MVLLTHKNFKGFLTLADGSYSGSRKSNR